MSKNTLTQTGFTLLEMLVVLVLMAFLVSLLMQGLGYINQLTARVTHAVNAHEQQYIQTQWLSRILTGLYPVGWREPTAIKGTPQRLEAVTLRSLQQAEGILVPFVLQADQSGRSLDYRENIRFGKQSSLTIWQATTPLSINSTEKWHFLYKTKQGKWLNNWPPKDHDYSKEKDIYLPYAICWCHPDQIGVLVSIQSRKNPPFDFRDSLGL